MKMMRSWAEHPVALVYLVCTDNLTTMINNNQSITDEAEPAPAF